MFYHSILYIKIIYYLLPIITINNNNGTSTTATITATNSNNTDQPPPAQTHIHQRHLKKKNTHTQPERSAQPQISNPSAPSQISNPQHHPKIPSHNEMVASKIRETWTARHNSVLALLVLNISDDDGSCAVSGELASRVLAHDACASSDNGHLALELIVWRCGVCSFSIEGGAGIWCEKREKIN